MTMDDKILLIERAKKHKPKLKLVRECWDQLEVSDYQWKGDGFYDSCESPVPTRKKRLSKTPNRKSKSGSKSPSRSFKRSAT
jgi:hypothetical protein